MKLLFTIVMLFFVCTPSIARDKSTTKMGESALLGPPDVGQLRYETVTKHNLICNDLDRTLLITVNGAEYYLVVRP